MDIPAHLQRMQSQHPDLTGNSNTYRESDLYTIESLPRNIPLSRLPGQRLYDSLRWLSEFKLLKTDPEATFDSDEAGEWLPQYYIGGGGYGKVGVYVKRNAEGNVIDELALKEMQNCDPGLFWEGSRRLGLRRRLLAEAAMQSQLNQSQSENFVHLRDYKYFNLGVDNDRLYNDPESVVLPDPKREKWRFYLELAPYGDLYTLLWKYQHWNQYLPEAFLWHVFDSLAEAAVQMRDCNWADMPTDRDPKGPPHDTDEMVHFDIKPDNIFLSYPDHRNNHHEQGGSTWGGSQKYDYPVIKLGDYGLNMWTGLDDQANPARLATGTSGFMPPEMMYYGVWWKSLPNANWEMPFSDTLQPRDRSSICAIDLDSGQNLGYVKDDEPIRTNSKVAKFRYNQKLHVWAIGKVMYDLMTLSGASTYWKKSTVVRDEFVANGNHQLPNFDQVPFQPFSRHQRSPYRVELTNLVKECLRPFWVERPDVEDMKAATARGMKHWDDKYLPGCEDVEPEELDSERETTDPKLIYRNNDMNRVRRGKERFVVVENDPGATQEEIDKGFWQYQDLKDAIRLNPDWPELKPDWDHDTAAQRMVGVDLMSVTHHQQWASRQFGVQNTFRRRYEVVNGGLRRRPKETAPWPFRDNDNDDDGDDDDDDDGNTQNPYPPPPLPTRGQRRSRSRSPPRASPLSPGPQQSTVSGPRQVTVPGPQQAILFGYQPISQQVVLPGQQLTTQPPTTAPDWPKPPPRRERSIGPTIPRRWRSLSPPAPPPADPVDYITDPSDSEVEIAVRVLRNGRRISHYRPKRKNLRAFNREYVRRRRGDKVNAKAAPWLASGVSKFDDAIRRRREPWLQSRRDYDRRRLSYERRKAIRDMIDVGRSEPLPTNRAHQSQSPRPRVMYGPGIHRPNSWVQGWQGPGTPASPADIYPNISPIISPHQNSEQPDFVQPILRPLLTPPRARLPDQANWTDNYFRAWTAAQAGQIPPLPPDADPTDRNFYWNWILLDYRRIGPNGGIWSWHPPDSSQPQTPGFWQEVIDFGWRQADRIYVDPNATVDTDARQNLGQPAPPQNVSPFRPAAPQTAPHRPAPRQPTPPPVRLPHQAEWTDEYFDAWTRAQDGRLPLIPSGVDPTDHTFTWDDSRRMYVRQDESNRTLAWSTNVPGLAFGQGQWVEVRPRQDTGFPYIGGN